MFYIKEVYWSDEAFSSRYFRIFSQRTHTFDCYLVYCYMRIDIYTIFTNIVNRKQFKSSTVDCFKVMVKKNNEVPVTMNRLVLVIKNKKRKEILYLNAFGYRPYQNDKQILKIKQMATV